MQPRQRQRRGAWSSCALCVVVSRAVLYAMLWCCSICFCHTKCSSKLDSKLTPSGQNNVIRLVRRVNRLLPDHNHARNSSSICHILPCSICELEGKLSEICLVSMHYFMQGARGGQPRMRKVCIMVIVYRPSPH